MGKKYIDIDAFIARERELYCSDCEHRKGKKNGDFEFVNEINEEPFIACWIDDMIDELENAPAADVEEVRHGKWTQDQFCKSIYYCSECGRHVEDVSRDPYDNFPYCHCGAKMGGGTDNEQTY